MNLHYKAAFEFYDFGWRLALPWLKLNHRLTDGYHERALKDKLPDAADLWIQAASVGESFLALEILEAFKFRNPVRILLTSNTRQGFDILKREIIRHIGDSSSIQAAVRYFPFDRPSIMSAAVAAIRPKLTVLLETEIWPGLLLALKTQGCKSMIVNGRITAKSFKRYHLWPSIWQHLRPDRVLAISTADADRYRRLFGPDGIDLMNNIKFDRVASPDSGESDQSGIASVLPSDLPTVILASVRQEEEQQVKNMLQEINRKRPQAVVGLFPRHIQRLQFWQDTLTRLNLPWVLRSKILTPVSAGTVVIWDTFGELISTYRVAQSAFIGGSLAPLGGQNFLEALISGVIPVTGPSWENFYWVGPEIIEADLLKVAGDWQQAAALLLQNIDAPRPREEVIKAAHRFLKTRQGGTDQACRQIEAMLFGE
jgi:3-deoxy-D-manno-octulosonic-acid transferase